MLGTVFAQLLATMGAAVVVSDALPMDGRGGWLGFGAVIFPMALRILGTDKEGWSCRLGTALQVALAVGVLGLTAAGFSDSWWAAIGCAGVTLISLPITRRVLLPPQESAERRLSEGQRRPLDLLVVVGTWRPLVFAFCALGLVTSVFLLVIGRDPGTAVIVGLFSLGGAMWVSHVAAESLAPYFQRLHRWSGWLQRAAFGVVGIALLGLPATELDLPRLVQWGGVAGGLLFVASTILGQRPQPSHWVPAREGLVCFSEGGTDLYSWEIVTGARLEGDRVHLSISGDPDRYVLGPQPRRPKPEVLIFEESLMGSTPEAFVALVNRARESMAFRLSLPSFRFADGTDEEVLADL